MVHKRVLFLVDTFIKSKQVGEKKQTPEQTIARLEQRIAELTAALEVYANADNWGET